MIASHNNLIDPKELGNRIRAARLKRKMTLVLLGLELGISHTQISRIERGQFIFESINVRKICTYLKINRSSLPAKALGIEARLAHFAKRSLKWRRVITALAEAMEETEARQG